jgi:hypothetical protein
MCDCELPDFCHQELRRARRPHRCVECGGVIGVGTSYEHTAGKWDGELDTFATCLPCADVRDRLARATGCCAPFGSMFGDAVISGKRGLRLRLDDVELAPGANPRHGREDEHIALATVAGLWFRWREDAA